MRCIWHSWSMSSTLARWSGFVAFSAVTQFAELHWNENYFYTPGHQCCLNWLIATCTQAVCLSVNLMWNVSDLITRCHFESHPGYSNMLVVACIGHIPTPTFINLCIVPRQHTLATAAEYCFKPFSCLNVSVITDYSHIIYNYYNYYRRHCVSDYLLHYYCHHHVCGRMLWDSWLLLFIYKISCRTVLWVAALWTCQCSPPLLVWSINEIWNVDVERYLPAGRDLRAGTASSFICYISEIYY